MSGASSAEPKAKISLALGAKKPPPTNGLKRSHAALHDDEDQNPEHGRAQTVSHFDKKAGGAIDHAKPKEEKKLLVIAPQANRDWKEAGRRKRQRNGGLPHEEARKGVDEKELEAREAAKKPGFGLNVYEKKIEDAAGEGEGVDSASSHEDTSEPEAATQKPRTADDEAMDALLGKTQPSDLVLPAVTEDQAFQRDYDTAPDMASLEDYARVPVEEFGAALLRGMGWKEGQGVGSERKKKADKTKIPERRPALLGIGAKPEAAVAQEMGTWGKAARGKEVKVYNPVLLRDRVTGEMFTEEEVKERKERAEREVFEKEFEEKEKRRRRREEEADGGSRERDRDRKDRDRRRDRERRDERDGRGDRDRDRERDRRRHDDSDEEYYRRKEKDRRRRDRERDDKDYDRERSRRHESDRDRERDRDRDHRRDRDRRR